MTRYRNPIDLGRFHAPNRIVMPPLVIWQAEETGQVTSTHLDHYRRSTGAGVVIVEATAVSPEGRLAATQLGLWDEAQIDGMAELASIITGSGAIAGIQIHHAGGRASRKTTFGDDPVAPSLLADAHEGTRELTEEGISRIVDQFGSAASRAVRAGFQLVEVHGAHGYLGSQFLSPHFNRRRDRWGGSLANRMRFLVEAVAAVDAAVGDKALTACRLGAADGREDGVSLDDGKATAKALVEAGCDLLDVSVAGSQPDNLAPADSPFDVKLHLAREIKKVVNVPVIGIGSIRTPEQADMALAEGMADLVAVGRGILADPGWARKATGGKADEIQLCEQCRPRCFHFTDASRCPARRKLAARRP